MTSYVSVIGQYGKGQNGFETSNVTFTNYRHNIRFGYRDLDESAVTYSWKDLTPAPHNNIGTVRNPNMSNPKIVTDIYRKYEVTTQNGKCNTRSHVEALVDSNYKINIDPIFQEVVRQIKYHFPVPLANSRTRRGCQLF